TDTAIVVGLTVCPCVGELIPTVGGVASIPGFGFPPLDEEEERASEDAKDVVVTPEPCVSKSEEITSGTLLTRSASSATKPLLRVVLRAAWLLFICCGVDSDCSFLQAVHRMATTISDTNVVKVFRDFIFLLDFKCLIIELATT